MKKKILAGVLALMMAAGTLSVPESVFLEIAGNSAISASAAATTQITVKDVATVTVNDTTKTIIIVPVATFFSKTSSTINIDFSGVKTELNNRQIDYSDYSILLNTRFTNSAYPNLSHVNFIDNFITSIGNSMFTGCTNLQTVSFCDSIKTLGSSVFSGCTSFAGSTSNNTVELNKITEIGQGAFSNCRTLVGINFCSDTTVIGISAFANCTKIKNVSIPNSVTTIGNGAFQADTSLTSVVFEKPSTTAAGTSVFNIDELGASVFSGCTSLTDIKSDSNDYNSLPSSITEVGANLFQGCTALTNFKIHKALKNINTNMFSGCTMLSSFEFEENSACTEIKANAFSSCKNLTSIELPQATATIGNAAFLSCDNLANVVISDNFTNLGAQSFANCYVLSLYPYAKKSESPVNTIILPDKVTVVPNQCFMNCRGIKSVDLNKVTMIGDDTADVVCSSFAGCIALASIDIPDAVTFINKNTFQNCTSLKTVGISKGLSVIKDNAFSGCTELYTLTPHGQTAYEGAIQIPSTCGGVQASGFANCSSFKYLNILKNSTDSSNFAVVGTSAFSNCTSLMGSFVNGAASRTIQFPEGVVVIQDGAFNACSKLDEILFSGNVTSIGDKSFAGCTGLTKVMVNPTITSIGLSAFENCKNLLDLPVTTDGTQSALTQLEVINDSTFRGCEALNVISIPKNITAIKNTAFASCTSLTRVNLDTDAKLTTIGNSAFDSCESLTAISTNANSSVSIMPSSIISIGTGAFNECGLSSFEMSKCSDTTAVINIGEGALGACLSLESADLSKANISNLSNGIFSGDTSLKTVKLPDSITTISANAFNNCSALSTINSTTAGTFDLPSNVKTIGGLAFNNNLNLSVMKIPAKTDDINLSAWNFSFTYTQDDIDSGKYNPMKEYVVDSANANFSSVDGILFNKDMTELYIYPFMKQGTEYTVPDTVTLLSSYAFSSNKILETVVINDNLQTIEKGAFSKCDSLKRVNFEDNATVSITNGAFVGMTKAKPIYISAKSGSTAETYAKKTTGLTFVDNEKEAATITIEQGSTYSVAIEDKTLQLTPVILTASGEPAEGEIKWTSSDISVAGVNDNGLVSLKNKGSVTLTATATTGITASITLYVGKKISDTNTTVTIPSETYVYTGSAITPDVTVKMGTTALVKDTDYTVSYTNNTTAGTATVVVTGKGDYVGTIEHSFKIEMTDVSASNILAMTSQVYTGSAISPVFQLFIGDNQLAKGTDYTVSYSNNINVGTAKITVTGIGKYSGTKTFTFPITAKSITSSTATLSTTSYPYTGTAKYPVPTVKDGATTLTNNKDYTVSYANNVKIGTGTVTIKGIGNYSGTITKTFTIANSITPATVTLSTSVYAYTGTAKYPVPTVKLNGATLTNNKDYTVSYANNVNAGTGTVTIKGIGVYSGVITKTFTIAKPISSATVTLSSTTYSYTGTAKYPVPTVKDGTTKLTNGTDYTVSYANNINVGTGTVTIKGIGKYSGTKTASFTIGNFANIANATVTLSTTAYSYTGTAKYPVPTVKYGTATLTNNKDYTVSYANNINVGTGTVTIKGIGTYAGTITKTFTISKFTPISSAVVTLSTNAYAYTGTAKYPVPTVTMGAVKLTNNKDYTVSYSNNVNVGTGTVTIKGIGTYSGTITKTFTISSYSSVSDATVTLSTNAYAYTGTAKYPVPTVTMGAVKLTNNKDYTVSYSNNVNVGTGTVTIKGIGMYTGTVSKTFTISSYSSISNAVVTLSTNAYAYTGTAKYPVPTVTIGAVKLTNNKDYTVSYSGNVEKGTGTVTIKGIGIYSGTVTANFTIQ